MDALLRDLRFGVKLLFKEKTFSATALLTLAICIGANAAIYSVIQTVLLEPLPFPEPDRLVTVYNSYPGAGAPRAAAAAPDFFFRRERVDAFQEMAAFRGAGSAVGEAGSTQRVATMQVSPSFFPMLGIDAELGRTFTEDEMDVGNHEKVVLTHAYWQEHFGGAHDAVGRDLRVDGRPYAVVGVLGPDLRLPSARGRDVRFFVPIPFTEEQRTLQAWHSNNWQLMARLAPGATVEQAQAQNIALEQALIDEWAVPNARQLLGDVGYRSYVVPAKADLVRDIESTLYMLWAGVAFVLLIGCINIANLLLARGQARVGEMATRLALGAPRARVARQVLAEAVVLGVVGGGLGVGVGVLGLRVLEALGTADLPRGVEIGIDGSVLLFTLSLGVAAGIVFGSIPVAQLLKGDLTAVFRAESRTGTASRRAVLVRSGLVVSQVALAFVMLIGAGLMFMSFRAALSVDPGFQPEGVFTGYVSLPEARYPDDDAQRIFTDELLREVRAIPGVRAAGVTSNLPFGGSVSSSVILPEGYLPRPGESLLSPFQTRAGPGYFEAMGIELMEGRDFQEADNEDARHVIVIDEWLANRYWPDASPLGDRMLHGTVPGMDDISEDDYFTVIGVVEVIKQNDLTSPSAEHVGAYYFTYKQETPSFLTLVVRTDGDAGAVTPSVREAVVHIDPELPLFGVMTLDERVQRSLQSRRVPLVLLAVFAGVALLLAVVGIYGALAYSVAQRSREIGIRLAMGSTPDKIFRIVVGHGLRVTGAGLGLGLVAALFLTRLIQSLLFEVRAADLRVMGVVAAALAVVGLVACAVPARRATAVDPVRTLGA